jgi:outer membrane immunogenic protein
MRSPFLAEYDHRVVHEVRLRFRLHCGDAATTMQSRSEYPAFMTKVAIGIVAIVALIGTPAVAADMALKAPPPAPVYSWTGFYVGGNAGHGWGDGQTDIAGNGSVTANIAGFSIPSSFAFADSNTARLTGVIGGGQFGFNYQSSPRWVMGLEADIQDTGKSGTGIFADTFATPLCTSATPAGTCVLTTPATGTALTNYQAKMDWFGTVRGRLGFLPNSQLLIYATGGLAYGHVEVSGSANVTAMRAGGGGGAGTAAFGASGTNVGFAVGTGMEGKFPYWLPTNWTWKLEYLHLDLGSLDATSTPFATPPLIRGHFPFPNPGSPAIGTITTLTHFTDNIVRVGLNYKFGY